MRALSNQEILEVAGGREQDVAAAVGGVFVGAQIGMLIGGPVGAVAGAISMGAHAAIISMLWQG